MQPSNTIRIVTESFRSILTVTTFDKNRLLEMDDKIRGEFNKLRGPWVFDSREDFEEFTKNKIYIQSRELVDAMRQKQIISAMVTKSNLYQIYTLIHNHPLSTPEFKKKNRELLTALLMV